MHSSKVQYGCNPRSYLEWRQELLFIRSLLRDELHQQHSPAEDICPAVVQLMANHLRRHVQVGAGLPGEDPHALRGQPPCQTHIRHSGMPT